MILRRSARAEQDYLADQLQRVSRSFALVIPLLEPPLREQIAVAYLLCRVCDNIEDCERSLDWKTERFAELREALAAPERAGEILEAWAAMDWPGLTEDERAQMAPEVGLPLWRHYAAIPARTRAVLRRWIGEMSHGMRDVLDPRDTPVWRESEGVAVLAESADYDRYCYIVAGTVGRMGTEMALAHYEIPSESWAAPLSRAEACGRVLQKTNIIKDFAKDVRRGVAYIPRAWMLEDGDGPLRLEGGRPAFVSMVFEDLREDLRDALAYVLSLPTSMLGYRKASLLCLLPALETLLLAARRADSLFTPEHRVKISRAKMMACLARAHALARDNEAIERHVEQRLAMLDRELGLRAPAGV